MSHIGFSHEIAGSTDAVARGVATGTLITIPVFLFFGNLSIVSEAFLFFAASAALVLFSIEAMGEVGFFEDVAAKDFFKIVAADNFF